MPATTVLLQDPLRWRASAQPHHPAIRYEDRVLTYSELDRRTNQLAHALVALGVKPGDRVALLGQNSPEFLESIYGIAKAGAISVPLGYRAVARELNNIISHSGCTAAIVETEYETLFVEASHGTDIDSARVLVIGASYETAVAAAPLTDPNIRVDDTQAYSFLYTSGTTGAPKGVVQSHRGRSLQQTFAGLEFDIRREDCVIAAAPLYNSGPIYWALMTVSSGATVGLVRRFDGERFDDDIRRLGVTYVPLMPTLFNRWIDGSDWKQPMPQVRMLLTAGEPMLANTRELLNERFPDAGMVEHYGTTESGVVLYMRPADFAAKPGSVGRPMFGAEVSLRDDNGVEVKPGEMGELWSRGISQMECYYRQPDVTSDVLIDGWMASGDLAVRDDDGFHYIVGRKKDTIKTGGATVYPTEIETVLVGHPAVRDAAVVGVPDDKWGELVVAAVVLEQGQSATAEDLIAYASTELTNYKRPRRIHFVAELPKSPAGKVLKRELKQILIEAGNG